MYGRKRITKTILLPCPKCGKTSTKSFDLELEDAPEGVDIQKYLDEIEHDESKLGQYRIRFTREKYDCVYCGWKGEKIDREV